MKRMILTLTLVLPVSAVAQQNDPVPVERQPIAASAGSEAIRPAAHPGGLFDGSSSSLGEGILIPPPVQASQATAGQTRPAAAVQQPRRPRPEGSMVGYIDNAIVGSQIRLRFDDGFNSQYPDRAEFFYAKCACYKGLAGIIPQAFDPNASGPGPGVPTAVNFQQLHLDVEYAPRPRLSLFGSVPVRWLQPQGFKPIPPFPAFSNQSGIGDIRLGLKAALVASADRDLTLQFHVYTPSGDGSKGMGVDHASLEPALLYNHQVSERATVASQIGVRLPIGGNDGVPTAGTDKFSGSVFFYGIGPSYVMYTSSRVRFAPVVELVGWRVMSGFQTQPGGPLLGAAADVSGTNIVNIKFGARASIDGHHSFYVGYGRVLTDAAWYKNIVRIEYRRSF